MELQDIIRILKSHGVTGYQVEQETDLSQVGVDKLINGVSKKAQKRTLRILEDYIKKHNLLNNSSTNVIEQFDNGEVENVKVNSPFFFQNLENNNSNQFVSLESGQFFMLMPLAEYKIQAGFVDKYQDEEFLEKQPKHGILVDQVHRGKYLAFRVKGDSMDNGKPESILPGQIVAARELQRHLWRDRIRFNDFPYWVIFTSESSYPLLKEIIDHDTVRGVITCHSLNDSPEYTDFELPLDNVQALFYVVDINRKVSKRETY